MISAVAGCGRLTDEHDGPTGAAQNMFNSANGVPCPARPARAPQMVAQNPYGALFFSGSIPASLSSSGTYEDVETPDQGGSRFPRRTRQPRQEPFPLLGRSRIPRHRGAPLIERADALSAAAGVEAAFNACPSRRRGSVVTITAYSFQLAISSFGDFARFVGVAHRTDDG